MKINPNLDLNQLAQQQLNQSNDNQIEDQFKDILAQKEALMTDKSEDGDKKLQQDGQRVDKDLLAVSKQFESLFVGMMFKEMKNSIERSDFLDSGLERDVFEDMYYDELAEEAAKNSDFGIAKAAYRQLSGQELK